MIRHIKHLPARAGSKRISPLQGSLDLRIDRQKEIQGIGMGVLSDGTPFLTQRGLARLCGVQNAHIGTMGSEWNESPVKPRIATIRDMLSRRGVFLDMPYIQVKDGERVIYAYPDSVCLAILEYYAFDAGANCKDEARNNFRVLAGKALQDFIYTQVGYSPNATVPVSWQQFHDRVTLTYHVVPHGYFSIFKEIADIIVTLIRSGAQFGEHFVPDISVGQHWSKHWTENDFDQRYGVRRIYEHNYPSYFPQSKSNPQHPFCYPDAALGEFRRWVREVYLADKFSQYLQAKERQGALPPSFVQLALTAFDPAEQLTLPH
jgi:hypothetical protein